jgi:hypothetical protein
LVQAHCWLTQLPLLQSSSVRQESPLACRQSSTQAPLQHASLLLQVPFSNGRQAPVVVPAPVLLPPVPVPPELPVLLADTVPVVVPAAVPVGPAPEAVADPPDEVPADELAAALDAAVDPGEPFVAPLMFDWRHPPNASAAAIRMADFIEPPPRMSRPTG